MFWWYLFSVIFGLIAILYNKSQAEGLMDNFNEQEKKYCSNTISNFVYHLRIYICNRWYFRNA